MGFTGKRTMLNSREWLMSPNFLTLASPATMFWKKIAYGAGKFIAACYRGPQYVSSSDARLWSENLMPQQDYWNSIVYGGGLFVAVADTVSAYSSNGITFTMTSSTIGGNDVAYGRGVFVSVKGNSIGGYSYDGINWTQSSLPLTPSNSGVFYNSVTYGGGIFVAGSTYTINNQGLIAYSYDGITWTRVLISAGQIWNAGSIAYGNGSFIAVPTGVDSRKVFFSSDGINWGQNVITLPLIGSNQFGYWKVAYGAGVFSIINTRSNGISPLNVFLYGKGPAWYYSYLPRDQDTYSVGYGKGKFIVFGKNRISYTSSNELPESITTNTSIQKNVKLYAYGRGNHVIFPSADFISSSSSISDPFTWYESTLNSQNITDAVYGGGIFQAISSSTNGIYRSINGINWTTETVVASNKKSITYGKGMFVCVNDFASTYYTKSIAGGTWIARTNLPSPENITSIRYGLGRFIISTNGSLFISGSDVGNWITNSVPNGNWNFLEYGNGIFVAFKLGESNTFIYSTNGTDWTQGQLQENLTITSIKYGGGFFIATKNNGEIIYSNNGINWVYGVDNLENNVLIRGYGAGRFFFSTETGNTLFTLNPKIFRTTNVAAQT